MKILTWNLNSINARFILLNDLLLQENPDIVFLQEVKCKTENFPYKNLSHLPYNIYVHGQKSYNGVAILSKFSAEVINYSFLGNPCINDARFIEITVYINTLGNCKLISLYVPNGGILNSKKFKQKIEFLDSFFEYLKFNKSINSKIIIGGDFNVSPFDIDVYSPEDLKDTTCFSLMERKRLRGIFNLGFEDIYRIINYKKQEFSWWDYRFNSLKRNHGMRIDFIIATSNLATHFNKCDILKKFRYQIKSSDHAPIIASF